MVDIRLNRRHFLGMSAATIVGVAGIASSPFRELFSRHDVFVSAHKHGSKHYVSGISSDGRETFRLETKTACHSICSDPSVSNRAVVISRDPFESALVIDTDNKRVLSEFVPSEGRHFNGHGVVSLDGSLFYASQNDYEAKRGRIAVYSMDTGDQINEFDSGGIGPHEIKLLNRSDHLVVANGGVQTHPSTGRTDLNLKSMDASLVYLNIKNGEIEHVAKLAERQSSIRHIDISSDDQVAIGIQYKGKKSRPPLVAFQKGIGEITEVKAGQNIHWAMNNYTGSVCVDSDRQVAAITCPRSNLITFWDMQSLQFIKALSIFDASGVSLDGQKKNYLVTSGTGHLVLVDSAELVISDASHGYWENAHWGNHLSRQASSFS